MTDHRTAFSDRWGGWYVTGTHGRQTHMGNQTLAADAKRVLVQNDPSHPWLKGNWPNYPSKLRTLNPFAGDSSVLSSH